MPGTPGRMRSRDPPGSPRDAVGTVRLSFLPSLSRGPLMDIGSLLGLIFGFLFIAAAIMMHGSLSDFVDVPGALVAFGGSFSAIMIAFPAKKVLGIFGITKQVFTTRVPDAK